MNWGFLDNTAGGNSGASTEAATCKTSSKLLDKIKRLCNSTSVNLSALVAGLAI